MNYLPVTVQLLFVLSLGGCCPILSFCKTKEMVKLESILINMLHKKYKNITGNTQDIDLIPHNFLLL
jgi:hypothetical protein